jgi:hypothetical protein
MGRFLWYTLRADLRRIHAVDGASRGVDGLTRPGDLD